MEKTGSFFNGVVVTYFSNLVFPALPEDNNGFKCTFFMIEQG